MDEIIGKLRELLESTPEAVDNYRERGVQSFADEREEFAKCIGLLRDSWQDEHPGRDRPQAFFVSDWALDPPHGRKPPIRRLRYEPFWCPELISDLAAAEAALGPKGRLCGAHCLTTAACAGCAYPHAVVVGTYRRTESSPLGEAWTHQLHTLCTQCVRVTPMPDLRQDDIQY